jgi:SAM-dependent methyltransferase
MPFAEYRGGGKAAANIQSMESRWDTEWNCKIEEVKLFKMEGNENWARIQTKLPFGRVLEAGCGIAKWVAFLEKLGYEAYGLDFSAVAIQKSLQIWPTLRLSQGDLRAMPYADGFFNGIISFGAIEHDINGPQAALTEMYRVLRPGGMLYCTVPCMNWIRRAGLLSLQNRVVRNRVIRRLSGRQQDVEFFEYVFTPNEYASALRAAGFELIELVPLNPYSIESKGRIRRWMIQKVHNKWPWCQAHMMAALGRKP